MSRPECHPIDTSTWSPSPSSDDDATTSLFVITDLRFGTENEGLDLDCVDTPDACTAELCREGPDDGDNGVDNRLGPLAGRISTVAGSDLQAEMTEAVASGLHPLVLSVVEATSLSEGGAKAVEISFGLDADGDPSDLKTGRGVIKADPNAPSERPSRFSPVAIKNGVVSAGPSRDWMPLFWTRGQIAAVPVVASYLRFRITPEGTVEEGVMVGAMSPGDLSKAILDMDARTAKVLKRLGPIVRTLVRQQSDLDLIPPGGTDRECGDDDSCLVGQTCRDSRCFESDQHFDSISYAILFKAVPVSELH